VKPLAVEPNYRTHPDEYICWSGMRVRCSNSKRPDWKDYGGRGIAVCERWNSFATFCADMGPRPSRAHSLDRIDNDGNYEPGNCRWATPKEQRHNRRDSVTYTFDGFTGSLHDWSQRLGLNSSSLYERIQKMPLEKALSMGRVSERRRSSNGTFAATFSY
jgi:hypothetical protein